MGGFVKESKTVCSVCPVRGRCAVRRILGKSEDDLEKRVVSISPNEIVSREAAFQDEGILTVRRGLVANAFHIGPDESLFFSHLTGQGCSEGMQYILKDVPTHDFVVSLGRAEVCVSDREAISHAFATSPDAAKEMLAAVYDQSGRSARLSWVKSAPTARQKVERLFSEMALGLAVDRYQEELDLDISHSSIASVTETNRTTVTRTLTEMQEEGRVSCSRRRIALLPGFFERSEHAKNPWAHGIRTPVLAGENINP